MDRALTPPWLLIATPQLQDPNFKKSVVLIVEHSAEGSMGFVLNRPLQAPLADLVRIPDVTVPETLAAWYGGPVQTDTGIVLHDRTQPDQRGDDGQAVMALASTEAALVELVDQAKRRIAELAARTETADGPPLELEGGLHPYRFVVGYAGWGAGQLLAEMHAGAWIQSPALWRLVFNTNWKSLWDETLAVVGVSPRAIAPTVSPYLN